MKNSAKLKTEYKTFLISFFVLLFAFVGFLNPTFTSDSVWDSFDTEVKPFPFLSHYKYEREVKGYYNDGN